MCNTPQVIISAFEFANDGNTKPGQSQRQMSSLRLRVWKCLVLPGLFATPTSFLPHKTLITDDLPTLGYPTVPTIILSFPSPNPRFSAISLIKASSSPLLNKCSVFSVSSPLWIFFLFWSFSVYSKIIFSLVILSISSCSINSLLKIDSYAVSITASSTFSF